MSVLKLVLLGFIISLGLSGMAQAQYFAGQPIYPGSGFNAGFNGIFGVPGTYSNLGTVNRAQPFAKNRFTNAPKTYNNMGGLMNTITRNTGKPGSYRSGPAYYSVNRKRPKL